MKQVLNETSAFSYYKIVCIFSLNLCIFFLFLFLFLFFAYFPFHFPHSCKISPFSMVAKTVPFLTSFDIFPSFLPSVSHSVSLSVCLSVSLSLYPYIYISLSLTFGRAIFCYRPVPTAGHIMASDVNMIVHPSSERKEYVSP